MKNRRWSFLMLMLLMTFIWAQPDLSVAPLQFDISLSHYTEDLEADCTLTITDNGDGTLDFGWKEVPLEPTVTFTKANYADYTMAENQDRISDSVWITRKDVQSLYNAQSETGYSGSSVSPEGTLWYFEGITGAGGPAPRPDMIITPTGYMSFINACNSNPPSIVDVPGTLFLIDDSVYLDIVFHHWSSGEDEGGGGFSYTRDNFDVPWLKVSEVQVRTANWMLDVSVDASGLVRGDYSADIMIMSNDTDTPEILIPVNLSVDGPVPVVGVTPLSIDAGTLVQGESDSTTHKLIITNTGDADLYWNVDFNDLTVPEGLYFEKPDYADYSQEMYQDRITENVWLTRQEDDGLFNYAQEPYRTSDDSPLGTEWWMGPTSEFDPDYDYYSGFKEAADYSLSSIPGEVMSLHLIEEDIYFDVFFHKWTSGDNGGGFAYTREMPTYHWIGGEKTSDMLPGTAPGRVLSVGQSDTVDVYFISAGVPGGDYFGELILNSNDPVNPEIVISVALNVYEPTPIMEVDVQAIAAEASHYTGTLEVSEDFVITNSGDADLIFEMMLEGGAIPITVSKPDYGDYMDPAHHDSITPNVVLTRANSQGLFNLAQETGWSDSDSPYGTEWSSYPTAESSEDDYGQWRYNAHPYRDNSLGRPVSLHLTAEDLYFDVVFNHWTSDGNGGGFSYTRFEPTPQWAWLPVTNDTIPFDEVRAAETYSIEFDASGLEPGDYHTDLIIHSNDPMARQIMIPVDLFVDGPMPTIDLTPVDIDLTLMAGTVDTNQKVTIANNGDADLFWKLRIDNPMAESVTFTKESWADYYLPENQDRITPSVWITRADYRGLFNIARETEYSDNDRARDMGPGGSGGSPIGTVWAPGHTNDVDPGMYASWEQAVNSNPPSSVGQTYSMYLYWDNLYFDVTFNSWTEGGNDREIEYGGGGFSYTRTQVGVPWLEVEFNEGHLPFGTAGDVQLKFDTHNLPGGDYYADIVVSSMGRDGTEGSIPVHLFVDGPVHAPEIISIMDVPADQGGWVMVDFQRSFFDTDVPVDPSRAAEAYTVEVNDGNGWVGAATQVAYGQEMYSVLVHTTMDSSDLGDGVMLFRVVAAMDEGNWISVDMPGYSVDNIAPPAPPVVYAGAQDGNVILTWDAVDAPDLRHFNVYRGTSQDFLTAPENLVGTTETTEFVDQTISQVGEYFYRVSAVDVHGNEGDNSPVATIILGIEDGIGIPKEFALHRNYPNPFNPVTTIRYDLPEQAMVTIVIYDMLGRQINTLVNKVETAGYKSVVWNGMNQFGQPVGTGVYLYQINAGKFSRTNKMVLMK